MNAHAPVPTILQRQALAAYLGAKRDAIYHAERTNLHRAIVPAAEPTQPVQPEAVNCCATQVDDVETWRDVAMFYIATIACLVGWGVFGWLVVAALELLRGAK